MTEPLFSSNWYRVKHLTPRIRPDARVHRDRYRGETWYVLHDPAKDRAHRFNPDVYFLIALMDGRRSVEEIWRFAHERLGDEAPTQDELIRLLGQLHAADVLQSGVPPDASELFRRGRKQQRQLLRSRLFSPFAIKVPLVDPDRFLTRTFAWVALVFSWFGALVWLAVVLPSAALVAMHWDLLTANVLDYLFAPRNVLVLGLVFLALKVFHELGHGYACKAFGGEVHDMGVMFLVFAPVPYADATSSWSFPSKYQRALVGAGGMLAELFVAAIAVYVWVAAEPGVLRATAYNVLLVGGITTLLFNANPLLRFDGYYILSDLIEIPNLRSRSNRYLGFLVERYLFGNEEAEVPHTGNGERGWFVSFAVAAFVYRVFIVVAILLWALDRSLVLGILLGCISAVGWIGLPVARGVRNLLTGESLRRVRARAIVVSGGGLALLLTLIFLQPVPLRTRAEGVVWVPEEALVRAGNTGFIARVAGEPGTRVEAGDLIVQIEDPEHAARLQMLENRVEELEARLRALRPTDRVRSRVTEQDLIYARKELAEAQQLTRELEARASVAGTLLISREQDLPGRFVHKGELLAHVVDLDTLTVRAVVPQDDAYLVRETTIRAWVRLSERISRAYPAAIQRIVPAASNRLPSPALGTQGGGEVPVDPMDPGGDLAVKSMFVVDLTLPAPSGLLNVGGRVYVRFDHGTEPLGRQWYRRVRQLFLSRFHV